MKELNSEEMTSVRGGFLNISKVNIASFDNNAYATNVVNGTANHSGGVGAIVQEGEANAGNIAADVLSAAS